jgi:hypothetical protein
VGQRYDSSTRLGTVNERDLRLALQLLGDRAEVARSSGSDANEYEALHWNGRTWSSTPMPTPADSFPGGGTDLDAGLRDVACASSSSCWAVGSTGEGRENEVLHWNGMRWVTVPVPQPPHHNNTLSGVTCTSTTSCWAVGVGLTKSGNEVLHWDGASWSLV